MKILPTIINFKKYNKISQKNYDENFLNKEILLKLEKFCPK